MTEKVLIAVVAVTLAVLVALGSVHFGNGFVIGLSVGFFACLLVEQFVEQAYLRWRRG